MFKKTFEIVTREFRGFFCDSRSRNARYVPDREVDLSALFDELAENSDAFADDSSCARVKQGS